MKGLICKKLWWVSKVVNIRVYLNKRWVYKILFFGVKKKNEDKVKIYNKYIIKIRVKFFKFNVLFEV